MSEAAFAGITVAGGIHHAADDAQLAAWERKNRLRLPASYKVFVRTFGYGLFLHFFIIYVPMDHEESLEKRSASMKGMLETGLREKMFDFRPDGSPEVIERLFPFGTSENGDTLAWDTSEIRDNEYPIWLVETRYNGVLKVARNLFEFVDDCLGPAANTGWLDGAASLIRPTFRGKRLY